MTKFIVDTNILIRIITKDDQVRLLEIEQLIKDVDDGKIYLIVPTIVIAECCWLLKSFYNFNKKEISKSLLEILNVENVEAEEKISMEALTIYYEKNVDFADALLSIKSRFSYPILTLDKKDFKKLDCEFYHPNEI